MELLGIIGDDEPDYNITLDQAIARANHGGDDDGLDDDLM